MVSQLANSTGLTTAPLAAHFDEQGVEFMQFAFRWMNCLLMREISVKCTIRMWDTYLVSRFFRLSPFVILFLYLRVHVPLASCNTDR